MPISRCSFIDFVRLAFVALALVVVAVACSSPDPTPTPRTLLPTATPTPSPTPPPTPTPTPQPPSADVAVANARAASAELDAFRFTLSVTQANVPQQGVAGIWIEPGAYDVSVSLPVCPPPVPGAPAPTDCALLHAYREVKNENVAHSRSPNRAEGDWVSGSDLGRYGLAFFSEGRSPVEVALDAISLAGTAVVSETTFDGLPAYQIVARPRPAETTWLRIERGTNRILSFALVANDVVQEWAFSAHDEPLAVQSPFPADATDPIEWLSRKTIRLVENDPRFRTGSLRPFSPDDAVVVEALVDALANGTQLAKDDFQIAGRVLTVHFTDGTRLAVAQAGRNRGDPVVDHWYVQAADPSVVRSSELTRWWSGVDAYFTPVEVIVWPEAIALDEPARFSGNGWPDDVVVLSTEINGNLVEFGQAPTRLGSWEWEGSLPQGVQPGLREFQVASAHIGSFARSPETRVISANSPAAFSIDSRPVSVVYATSGDSALPASVPLWVGQADDEGALLSLLTAINDAPQMPAPADSSSTNSTLHVRHPDGTETQLRFAGACGVLTPTTVCTDNRWSIAHVEADGTQSGPTAYRDSASLSAWRRQFESNASPPELLIVRGSLSDNSRLVVTGDGWPGSAVRVEISAAAITLRTLDVPAYFGAFSTTITGLGERSADIVVKVSLEGDQSASVSERILP